MVKKCDALAAASKEGSVEMEVDEEVVSPKIEVLLRTIQEMKHDEKAVVFSQFRSYLDIIATVLEDKGIAFSRIDGRMNAKQRLKAMQEFNEDEEGSRVILCSLHAAGTGINLTRGNVVVMMDCWWNQSVESQAMDRVHRINQKRKVRVLRFVMKDSIEERMIEIQKSKDAQAKGAFGRLSDQEKRMSRVRDLRKLLDLQ